MKKEKSSSKDTSSIKQSKVPLYVSIAIVVIVVGSYFCVPSVNHFFSEAWDVLTSDDEARVKSWLEQFGVMGPLVIIIAMTLQMFLLVIPTPLLMVVSVLAYGAIGGGILILVAVFVASSVGYLIGAYLGTPVVEKLLGRKTEEKIASFIEDYGFWTVIVTRLSPFLSNDAISLIGGMLRMGYWRFIAATMAGIFPLTVLIAYLGQSIERLKTGLIWGSITSIVLFVAFVWWDKQRSKKNRK